MKYRLVEKKNPQHPDDPKKWYANAVHAGVITIHHLAERVALQSSLTRGDILNTLENALDVVPEYLDMGFTVSLGNLASLRLTLSSEGADTKETFEVKEMMKKPHVVFNPSTLMERKLSEITYERVED